MALNLLELQNNLDRKDAVSSTEGVTQRNVNNLCDFMNGGWSVKKSRRKNKQLQDLLCI